MTGEERATSAIRFVSGSPAPEEIAAVVAVVQARAAAAAAAPVQDGGPRRSGWARPAHVRHARPRSWDESRLPR